MRCDLCGEPSGAARHASPSECFVALRQAVDTARGELALARGEHALAAAALRQVADMLRPDHSPEALARVVARVRALVAPHAGR